MNTIQIHLLMLALGIAASVCVTRSSLFKRPGTGHNLTGPTAQQSTLGLLAFLVVAASPLIRFWRTSLVDLALLQQAFLLSAIGLLALLLYALLQRPFARQDSSSHSNSEQKEQSIDAIHIDADSNDVEDKTITPKQRRMSDDMEFPNSVEFFKNPINLSKAANDQAGPSAATHADSSNLSYLANLDQLVASNLAESNNENLDLSDTDQLFAAIRAQAEDVELPDNEDWRADFDETVNLDDSLVLADEHIATPSDAPEPARSIIEGELMEEETDTIEEIAETDQPDSATLNETLEMGKSNSVALQQHIDDLNKKLNELQMIQQQLSSEQQQSQLASAQMIINRDSLLDSEAKSLEAAESVINAQRKLLDQSKQKHLQFGQLLKQERARLLAFRDEAARSKSMAKQATALARKAAVANQTIRDVAKREQMARLRSQESTKKAVDIARNAITALAAEERKNASTHH